MNTDMNAPYANNTVLLSKRIIFTRKSNCSQNKTCNSVEEKLVVQTWYRPSLLTKFCCGFYF